MPKRSLTAASLAIATLAGCHGTGGGSSLPATSALRPQAIATGSYARVILRDNPVQYFQLNESSGPTALRRFIDAGQWSIRRDDDDGSPGTLLT